METLKYEILDMQANHTVLQEYIQTYNSFKTFVAESPMSLLLIGRKIIGFIIGLLKLIYKLLDKIFGKHSTGSGGGGSGSVSEDRKIHMKTESILNNNKHLLDREIVEMLAKTKASEEIEYNKIKMVDNIAMKMRDASPIEVHRIHLDALKHNGDYRDIWEQALEQGMYEKSIEKVYNLIHKYTAMSPWTEPVLAPAGFVDLKFIDKLDAIIEDIQDGKEADVEKAREILKDLILDFKKIVIDSKVLYEVVDNKIIVKPIEFNNNPDVPYLEKLLMKTFKTVGVTLDEKACKEELTDTNPMKYNNVATASFNKSAVSMNGFNLTLQYNDLMKSIRDIINIYTTLQDDIEKVPMSQDKIDVMVATMNIFLTQYNLIICTHRYTLQNLQYRAQIVDGIAIQLILNSIVMSPDVINLKHKVELSQKK